MPLRVKRGQARTASTPYQPIIHLGEFGANVQTVSPQDTSPFFSEFDLAIPRDLAVLNRLIDYYATFHPLIANSFDLHAEIAWSDFSITCQDASIQKDYEDLIDDLGLKKKLWACYHEWFKFGESVMVGAWNEDDKIWTEFTPIPMHKIRVEQMTEPSTHKNVIKYYYQVSPEDRRKMEAFANTAGGQTKYWTDYVSYDLSTNFIEAYLNYGDIIPIHEFYMFRVVRPSNGYDLRGRSLGLRILRDALLEDYLQRAQLKVARDRLRAPDVWLIGDPDRPPDDSEIDYWRTLVERQANDPNYQIVAAPPMELRNYSANLRLLQMEPEVNRIMERMALSLWTPLEGMKNYSAATYAGQATLQQVRESRYSTYRKIMEEEIIKKIFMPIAVARKYIKKTKTADGGAQLILPSLVNHPRSSMIKQEIVNLEVSMAEAKHFKYEDMVERMSIEGENMSKLMKIAGKVSRRDLDLPTIVPKDRIRLQDNTEKLRVLLQIAGKDNYPIPFKFICEELGYNYDKIIEYYEEMKEGVDPMWQPAAMKTPSTERSGMGLGIPGGGFGGDLGGPSAELSPPPGLEGMPGPGEGEALQGESPPPPVPKAPVGEVT